MSTVSTTLAKRLRIITAASALIAGLAAVPAYAADNPITGVPEPGAKCNFYDNGSYYACTINNGGGSCTDVTSTGKILTGTCIYDENGNVIGVSGLS